MQLPLAGGVLFWMDFVRVPLVGISIAVALLIIENLGAIAYRKHRTEIALEAAEARDRTEHDRQLREVMEKIRALDHEIDLLKSKILEIRGSSCGGLR